MVPVSLGKVIIASKYCKSTIFQIILSRTDTFYLVLSLFDNIDFYLILMNFKPVISPVDREFLLNRVNFIM